MYQIRAGLLSQNRQAQAYLGIAVWLVLASSARSFFIAAAPPGQSRAPAGPLMNPHQPEGTSPRLIHAG